MPVKENLIFAGFGLVAALVGLAELLTVAEDDTAVIVVNPEFREFVQSQVASANNGGQSIAQEDALEYAIEEEMLYREAVRLGLDQGDLIVKRRVVQKMRFLMEASTPLEQPTSEQLEAWLAEHPDQFQIPRSVKIEHYFFARTDNDEAALALALDGYERLLNTKSDIQSSPHPFDKRTGEIQQDELTRELGSALTEQIMAMPLNEWSKPMNSALGFHLIKVNFRTPAQQMTVQQAGQALVAVVREAQRERMNEAALKVLASRYRVDYVGSDLPASEGAL